MGCSNTDGTVAVDDDCLCGTAKANKNQFCIKDSNAVNTAVLANCASVGGHTAVAANAACKCGPTTGARSNDICVTGQFCDGGQAGTGNSGANGKCLTTAAAPTFGAATIVQKLSMSGTQTDYTGNVMSLAEEAYGKVLGIFDTTATPQAYATGCSVTSEASARRAYTVTFTATTSASTGNAATTAATALTSNIAAFTSAAAAVKAANNAYNTVTAPTATSAATATTTAVPTVSGAFTVTTSIMAMAVAVLAAFQARQ